jgi:hypothetical protein
MNIILKNTSRFSHHSTSSPIASSPPRHCRPPIVIVPILLPIVLSPSHHFCPPIFLPIAFPHPRLPILLPVASLSSSHCHHPHPPPFRVLIPILTPTSLPPHCVVILVVLPCHGPPSSSPRCHHPVLLSLRSTNPEKKTLVIGNKEKTYFPPTVVGRVSPLFLPACRLSFAVVHGVRIAASVGFGVVVWWCDGGGCCHPLAIILVVVLFSPIPRCRPVVVEPCNPPCEQLLAVVSTVVPLSLSLTSHSPAPVSLGGTHSGSSVVVVGPWYLFLLS